MMIGPGIARLSCFVSQLVATAFFLVGTGKVQADTNSGYLAGNRTVVLQVCDGTDGSSPLRRWITFHGFGTASTMTVDGVPALPVTGGVTADLPTGQSCMDVTVVTAGIPSNTFPTTVSSVHFLGCIEYPPPGGPVCSGGVGGAGFREYKFVYPVKKSDGSNPTATLSPPTIYSEGSTAVTLTMDPPIAATVFNSSQPCTVANGVQANVSEPNLRTNISGKATFMVNVPVLNVPAPPGTPSGSCSFTAPIYSVTNVLPLQATSTLVSIYLSTSIITQAGITPVQATIFPVHPVARVTIDATCTSTIANVFPVAPASVQTDAAGHATISISASGLVNVNPNTNVVPSAQCTYKVRNITASALVGFTTANACTFTDLQPKPAACGNPAN